MLLPTTLNSPTADSITSRDSDVYRTTPNEVIDRDHGQMINADVTRFATVGIEWLAPP